MSRFSVVMKRLALLSPPPSNCHTFYNVKRSSPTVAGGRRRLIKGSLSAADTLAPVPTLHLTGPRPLEGKFILRFRRRPSFSLSFCLFSCVCVYYTYFFLVSAFGPFHSVLRTDWWRPQRPRSDPSAVAATVRSVVVFAAGGRRVRFLPAPPPQMSLPDHRCCVVVLPDSVQRPSQTRVAASATTTSSRRYCSENSIRT